MTDKPILPGVKDPLLRTHRPYPYMPSTQDGKPFYRPGGREPIILHTEEEENAFRADHPEVADRSEPLPPAPQTLEEAQAEIDQLRAENAALKAEVASLRPATKSYEVDTDRNNDGVADMGHGGPVLDPDTGAMVNPRPSLSPGPAETTTQPSPGPGHVDTRPDPAPNTPRNPAATPGRKR